jgi:hypothetical protein
MDRWFLMLPDIFHFFTIFGLGVLTGIFVTFALVVMYCWGGGEIQIKYAKKENEDVF